MCPKRRAPFLFSDPKDIWLHEKKHVSTLFQLIERKQECLFFFFFGKNEAKALPFTLKNV
jgi:hypothetical protein